MTQLELRAGQRDACLRKAQSARNEAAADLRKDRPEDAEFEFKQAAHWEKEAARYQRMLDRLQAPKKTEPWWRKLPIPCKHREPNDAA